MKSLALFTGLVGLAVTLPNEAQAQYRGYYHRGHYHYYGNYNNYNTYRPGHYHDSAGHMIDAAGHHVDSYGNHTGNLGLFEGNVVGNSLPYSTYYGSTTMNPMYGQPIRITHPSGSTAPINYSLNGFQYTIRPGESQTLVNDRLWTIQFDRGGEFGRARYSLSPGQFEFTVSAAGWDFVQRPGALDAYSTNGAPPPPSASASGVVPNALPTTPVIANPPAPAARVP